MSDSNWRSLGDRREALLLGELGGLLHDWEKCMDWGVARKWGSNPGLNQKRGEWTSRRTWGGPVVANLSRLLGAIRIDMTPGSARADLKTLADKGSDPSAAEAHPSELVRLMGRCHDIAHVERSLAGLTSQIETSDRLGGAFGYEYGEPDNLLSRLDAAIRPYLETPASLVPSRSGWLPALRETLSEAWGDTRRPVNEVTLWDWSYAVASLYKSELARHFLTGEWRQRDELRWRLLRINFDVLELYSRAIKLADVFGYVHAVEEACERAKRFVEDEYPLGNEVYRDTTGIYFTFPDIDLAPGLGQEVRRIVEDVEAELVPRIDAAPAEGMDPEETLKRLLAATRQAARNELSRPFGPDNLGARWTVLWENLPDGAWEVCPVCRLRPKKEEDDVCEHCGERRQSRIEEWRADPKRTIWLDELADENSRLALVVGRFGLDDWLSGDLVQTLLVRAAEDSPGACVSKNSSPARLRRIWETCQRFWEGTVSDILGELRDGSRWKLLPADLSDARQLPEACVCDGTLAGRPISVFRIADHLLTVSFCSEKGGPSAGRLRVSWERGKEKQRCELAIQGSVHPSGDLGRYATYHRTLTLLTTPDQFVALVPAREALKLATNIRNAYGREFGKVQNRLPIFLGLVFFQRKTPLFAVMDTARRMLQDVQFSEETWTIDALQGGEVGFENGNRWNVPIVMADGSDDLWYPYFFVDGHASHFRRAFQCAEGKYKDRRMVHASELAGAAVRLTPSRFAYFFLEHSAQRFQFDPARDAMLLDELPRLVGMWERICRARDMTDTRLRAVADLLQIKGERWGAGSDEFKELVETTLRRAWLWEGGEKGAVGPNDVTSGRFRRCLEIYLRILKQRVKEERHEQHAGVAV